MKDAVIRTEFSSNNEGRDISVIAVCNGCPTQNVRRVRVDHLVPAVERIAAPRVRSALFDCRYMEELDIPLDTDLTAASASEIERNKEVAGQDDDTVAAAVGIDTLNWKFTRILLATNEPGRTDRGVAYEILHLARPLLNTLPEGEPR
jgi:hypothetical protein